MSLEPSKDGRVAWGAINKQHPMPSFILPSSQVALRELVPKDHIANLCSKITDDKAKHDMQQYRASIMVPVFDLKSANMFDEQKMRAHIELGRKHHKKKNEIDEAMNYDGLEGPGQSARGSAFRSKAGGVPFARKKVTGKIGRNSGTVANLDIAGITAGRASSRCEVERAHSRCDVERAQSRCDVERAPSRTEVDRAPSRCDVERAQSRCEVERAHSRCEVERPSSRCEVDRYARESNIRCSSEINHQPTNAPIDIAVVGMDARDRESSLVVPEACDVLAEQGSGLTVGGASGSGPWGHRKLLKGDLVQAASKKGLSKVGSGHVLKRSGKNVYVAPFVPFLKSNRTKPLRCPAFREERAKTYAPAMPPWSMGLRGVKVAANFSNL